MGRQGHPGLGLAIDPRHEALDFKLDPIVPDGLGGLCGCRCFRQLEA